MPANQAHFAEKPSDKIDGERSGNLHRSPLPTQDYERQVRESGDQIFCLSLQNKLERLNEQKWGLFTAVKTMAEE